MKHFRIRATVFAILAFLLGGLGATNAEEGQFRKYWNQGKGEISRYHLTQSRYGELHEGDAVLIFVTEPFSKSKQVKLDNWEGAGDDLVNVLKLNFTKKFLTGIYPYSLMFSTFTPIDTKTFPHSLKTTMSGQEWCGQVYGQLNLRENHYESVQYSYFESEGDTRSEFPVVFLEDEIWTRIRLTPEDLPTGEFLMIPGSFISRLTHTALRAERVKAEYVESRDPEKTSAYRVNYETGGDRELTIFFEKAFPHGILGWEETYAGLGGKRLTTRAERTAVLLTDYWKHHNPGDRGMRKELDLPPDR